MFSGRVYRCNGNAWLRRTWLRMKKVEWPRRHASLNKEISHRALPLRGSRKILPFSPEKQSSKITDWNHRKQISVGPPIASSRFESKLVELPGIPQQDEPHTTRLEKSRARSFPSFFGEMFVHLYWYCFPASAALLMPFPISDWFGHGLGSNIDPRQGKMKRMVALSTELFAHLWRHSGKFLPAPGHCSLNVAHHKDGLFLCKWGRRIIAWLRYYCDCFLPIREITIVVITW